MKAELILAKCPEDNFAVEPEGVDIPPVDPASPNPTTAREVKYSVCEMNKKEPLPKGGFQICHVVKVLSLSHPHCCAYI